MSGARGPAFLEQLQAAVPEGQSGEVPEVEVEAGEGQLLEP